MNQLTINGPIINQPTKKINTMEINQNFSLSRFGHLMQRELSQNKSIILIVVAVILTILCVNSLAWAYNREHGYHEFAYPFFLLVSGFILTSLSFTEMNRPDGKIFYLLLPASSLEKFISKWLITGIGFASLFTLGYYLFSFIGNSLGNIFFDFNHGAFNFFTEENTLIFQIYLAVQTIFLLGATYFRKYAIFKTAFSTILFVLSMAALSALLFRLVMFDLFDGLYHFNPFMEINGKMMPVEPSKHYQRYIEQNAIGYFKLLGFWILPAILLVIGYFKLKETEF